jgi:effector-binding domain-containing protein
MKLRQCDYEIGFPVSSLPENFADGDSWVAGKIPAHKALKITHQGAYQNLGNAWSMGFNRLRALKLKQVKSIAPYEIYASDPETTLPEDIKTELFWPLKG